jgi:putative nucleotidyltransferase with HDIG domain
MELINNLSFLIFGGNLIMEQIKLDLPQDIRDGVVEALPLINKINDTTLRQQVIDAWALALVKNDYKRIEEIPGAGIPGGPILGNQAQHINAVTQLALAFVDILESTHNQSLNVDIDLLIACGLAHDVGKPFEFNPKHRARWESDYRPSGLPALRHTLYGVYIALTVGLPEAVVHVCGCHSPEGRLVKRSLPATIIHLGDEAYWQILESALCWTLPLKDNTL